MIALRWLLLLPACIAALAVGSADPAWLALGLYLLTDSGLAFTRDAGARNVVRLGGAMGALQMLTPMGALIVAGLLPVLGGAPRGRTAIGRYVLLFFLPVFAALCLLLLALAHLVPQSMLTMQWPPVSGLAFLAIRPMHVLTGLAWDAAAFLGAFPFLMTAIWAGAPAVSWRTWLIAVPLILLVASMIATANGASHRPFVLFGAYLVCAFAACVPRTGTR